MLECAAMISPAQPPSPPSEPPGRGVVAVAGPPDRESAAVLDVAAGVIVAPSGCILIARRPPHLHQGDRWEFPGGKVEPGETPERALRRELAEELDITVEVAMPLIRIRHDYPDRRVCLHVFRVERFSGTPRGLLGQPLRWVEPDRLREQDFPAANHPIITAARLPDRYAIIELADRSLGELERRLRGCRERNLRLVRLRGAGLPADVYEQWASRLVPVARALGIAPLLSGDPALVERTGAAGLHLNTAELMALGRRPLGRSCWVAASCHSAAELQQAERVGVDFAVLGPVLPTATHPERRPLGWAAFRAMAEPARIPLYALGGMRLSDIDTAKQHGAQGIAAIRGIWG